MSDLIWCKVLGCWKNSASAVKDVTIGFCLTKPSLNEKGECQTNSVRILEETKQ